MFSFQIEKVDRQDNDAYKTQHYLQTDFWADFKSMHGWKKMLYKVNAKCESTDFSFYVSILVRHFAKFFNIAYVPLGIWMGFTLPNEKISDDQYFNLLIDFSKAIKKELPKNTILIRFDPPYEFYDPDERDKAVKDFFTGKNAKYKFLKKNAVDIQPPDTTILDLSKSEDELLSAMKSKWRYNIHLAEKKGVRIEKGSSQDIDVFYDLYLETSKRDGIAIHSKKYYQDLLELSEKKQKENSSSNPLVSLYIAKHENDTLAAIITLFTPYQATYVYGASCNIKRNLMPAYLLQWTAIKDAKNFGSKTYDFYGMPPRDDETHPMYGLYRFKTGFSGQNTHRIGSIDIAISPLYKPYKTAEKLRSFYFKKIKKAIVGR